MRKPPDKLHLTINEVDHCPIVEQSFFIKSISVKRIIIKFFDFWYRTQWLEADTGSDGGHRLSKFQKIPTPTPKTDFFFNQNYIFPHLQISKSPDSHPPSQKLKFFSFIKIILFSLINFKNIPTNRMFGNL